ncbi:MAG: hypothetical protein N3A38_11380 [Planctomycetota bacterium]|nr:hypothetical protein [Planctomycetota bacterium]
MALLNWRKAYAVFRVDMKQPGPVKPFLGNPAASGTGDAEFNCPTGVACDGDGNLYVADKGNNRIQVFRPDGGFLKSLPTPRPHLICVNRKTGNLYVTRETSSSKGGGEIVKIAGLNDPTVQASIPTRLGEIYQNPLLAAASGQHATIWVKLGYDGLLRRFEDTGAALKEISAGDIGKTWPGWEQWLPWYPSAAIAADPRREELYVRDWGDCWPSPAIRVEGRTGKVIERVCGAFGRTGGIESMAVSPFNGDLYLRLFMAGPFLTRYNPDTRKLVPLHEAQPWKDPVLFAKDQPLIGITLNSCGGARGFQDNMVVAPNGDLYIPLGVSPKNFPSLKAAGLDVPPSELAPVDSNLLAVFAPDGKLKCLSALPGLCGLNGIGVGRQGAVYVAIRGNSANVKLPDGLPDGSSYSSDWGAVIKFKSRFDRFPVGRIEGTWVGQEPGKPWHQWKRLNGAPTHMILAGNWPVPARADNMHWDYPGASPVAMGGCSCHRSKIYVDGFERLLVPAAQTCTVNVLDANGNIVARFGGYGNMDSRGKDSPVRDPKTGEYRPRRPDDPKDLKSPLEAPDIAFIDPTYVEATDEAIYVVDRCNERIVRVALMYKNEEMLALP